MHLLYIDDSGSVGNAQETHFVLGGVAVFERAIYHVIKALDDVVAAFGLGGSPASIELHGNEMYNGRDKPWSSVKRSDREEMIKGIASCPTSGLSCICHVAQIRTSRRSIL